MQKLAVALTTQEEFNEYMEYAETKNYNWADGSNPRKGWTKRDDYKQDTCVIVYKNTLMYCNRAYHESVGHKIISLKEAIGDKEIIREGEARGFEPKTGDRVMVSDYDNNYVKELYIATNNNSDYKYICVVERDRGAYKVAENFESRAWKYIKPIEEPKTEGRIDKVIKSIEPYLGMKKEDVLWDNVIREAIEKHMPKQKTISRYEIDKFLSTAMQSTKDTVKPFIIDLLHFKGLLE